MAHTILVVSREEPTLKLLRANLAPRGYKVVSSDYTAAQQRPQPHDLAIVEVIDPTQETLRMVRGLRDGGSLPVILLVSPPLDRITRQLAAEPRTYQLEKPFSIQQLLSAVASSLGMEPSPVGNQ